MATEEEKKKLLLYDSSYLDRLQKSQAALDNHLSARPGDYQSKYQEQINKAMESIANRKPFQYDVNGDALYQQYKDRYTQMGKQAMQNTMGQAAALTGGYGNTYAQQVGQQVYGQYMQGLTDKIPELYQLALSKYDRDAAAEKDRYNLYKDADATDYGRWGDKLNQWNTDRSYLSGRADTELSQALTIGNTLYQRLAELGALGYTPSDEELRAAGLTRGQWDTLHPAVSYGGGGDSGWSGGGSGGDSGGSGGVSGVLALGRGPISMDNLAGLVAKGEVAAEKKGNTVYVSNTGYKGNGNSNSIVSSNYQKYWPSNILNKKK